MGKCEHCGKLLTSLSSVCDCGKYEIFHRDYRGDEPRVVYGENIHEVCEDYALDYYSSDPGDPDSFGEVIEVVHRGNRRYFKLSAETLVNFTAKELT